MTYVSLFRLNKDKSISDYSPTFLNTQFIGHEDPNPAMIRILKVKNMQLIVLSMEGEMILFEVAPSTQKLNLIVDFKEVSESKLKSFIKMRDS